MELQIIITIKKGTMAILVLHSTALSTCFFITLHNLGSRDMYIFLKSSTKYYFNEDIVKSQIWLS